MRSLSEIFRSVLSKAPAYEHPQGRTVPAEAAIQPPSPLFRCSCGVAFQPRGEAHECLTCERGSHPILGSLIVPRKAKPVAAEEPSVVTPFRKGGAA
jgi:hypothetical protein